MARLDADFLATKVLSQLNVSAAGKVSAQLRQWAKDRKPYKGHVFTPDEVEKAIAMDRSRRASQDMGSQSQSSVQNQAASASSGQPSLAAATQRISPKARVQESEVDGAAAQSLKDPSR